MSPQLYQQQTQGTKTLVVIIIALLTKGFGVRIGVAAISSALFLRYGLMGRDALNVQPIY
jgi:hypothetical protein